MPDDDYESKHEEGRPIISVPPKPMNRGSAQSAFAPGNMRRAGRPATFGIDQTDLANRPLSKPIVPPSNRMIIEFMTHGRFTYVAVYLSEIGHWFISGSGKWFGTNELTNKQMSDVLMRDSTSHIRIMRRDAPGHMVLNR